MVGGNVQLLLRESRDKGLLRFPWGRSGLESGGGLEDSDLYMWRTKYRSLKSDFTFEKPGPEQNFLFL